MHVIFLDPAAASDELDDTANVAAHVRDPRRGITAFDITTDEFVLADVDDLKIVLILVAFEIMFRARRRAIEVVLQRLRYLDPNEQRLGLVSHRTAPFASVARLHHDQGIALARNGSEQPLDHRAHHETPLGQPSVGNLQGNAHWQNIIADAQGGG